MLALEAGEALLFPQLLEQFQVLEEVLAAFVGAAGAGAGAVDEAALANLVHDGDLLGDLEGVFGLEVVEGVALVGQGPGRRLFAGQPQRGPVDGGADADVLGVVGDDGGQHQRLGVHAALGGEVAAAEPDVVPTGVLDVVDFLEVLLVGLGFQELAALVVGVPGHHAALVNGVPGGKQSKVHAGPSCCSLGLMLNPR